MAESGAAAEAEIVSIVGTRPEAIKMLPLVRLLSARGRAQRLILTGQHRGLLASFADVAGCAVEELPFDPAGLSPGRLRHGLQAMLVARLAREKQAIVLVHGDTTSALAGAVAAREAGLTLGHVEAGLRSFDLRQPWPEERNRVEIDALAHLLFAPTPAAAENLVREPRATGEVHVTGNTGIDALLQARALLRHERRRSSGGRKAILATCHRRENQGEGIASICAALRRLTRELPVEILLPLHPNPHVRSAVVRALGGAEHVRLIEAATHLDMVRLMLRAWLVLTDSGGLQEEAPTLGRPVLVLRNVTERGEALASGNVALVGTDPERIVAAVKALFEHPPRYRKMARPTLLFGDGRASERIADVLEPRLVSRTPASAGRPAARVPQEAPLGAL